MISIMKTKMAFIAVAMLFLAGCATTPKAGNDISAGSVMITNMSQNHGGTGVVIWSSPSESEVLTNSHVCAVVEKGGVVAGKAGTFMVAGYKRSGKHDLCMIRVEGNLKHDTVVAKRPPVEYSEQVAVSGHPALMPNVKTYGHFSGTRRIPVMMGFRACTLEEKEDKRKGIICYLAGGMPIIRMYQSQLVTATIMPGSSGSGVYNKDLELSGLVFAGQGDLGYGWIVPYQSVVNFLDKEQYDAEYIVPTNDLDPFGGEGSEEALSMKKLVAACASPEREKIKSLCTILDSDLVK